MTHSKRPFPPPNKSGGWRILDLLILAAAGAAAYYGYAFLNPPADSQPATEAAAASPAATSPAALAQSQHIICVACNGEGQLMLRKCLGYKGKDKAYTCAVCGGRGFRDVVIPANARICPDCGGMGKRKYNAAKAVFTCERETATRLTARPCMRCHSLGYLNLPPAK